MLILNKASTVRYNNKPVGDETPRLAQMSLPWQQGSAHNIAHGSIESANGHPR